MGNRFGFETQSLTPSTCLFDFGLVDLDTWTRPPLLNLSYVCCLPEGQRLFEAIEDHVIPQVKLKLDNPKKEEVSPEARFLSVQAPPPVPYVWLPV